MLSGWLELRLLSHEVWALRMLGEAFQVFCAWVPRLPAVLCDDGPGNSVKLSPFKAPERKCKTGLLLNWSIYWFLSTWRILGLQKWVSYSSCESPTNIYTANCHRMICHSQFSGSFLVISGYSADERWRRLLFPCSSPLPRCFICLFGFF